MNRRGVVPVFFLVAIAYVSSVVISASFDIEKKEDKLLPKVSLSELTKSNAKTIWCKMKAQDNCDSQE